MLILVLFLLLLKLSFSLQEHLKKTSIRRGSISFLAPSPNPSHSETLRKLGYDYRT